MAKYKVISYPVSISPDKRYWLAKVMRKAWFSDWAEVPRSASFGPTEDEATRGAIHKWQYMTGMKWSGE